MFERVQPRGVSQIICSCQLSKLDPGNIDSPARVVMETIVWRDGSGVEWVWVSGKRREKVGSDGGRGKTKEGIVFHSPGKRHSLALPVAVEGSGLGKLSPPDPEENIIRERTQSYTASKQYFEEKTKNKKQGVEDNTNTSLEREVSQSRESEPGPPRNNLSKSVSKNSLLKIFKIK